MKKTFRFTIILIAVAIVATGIGFWRHHYLKVMNAEPVNVYNDTSVEPDTSPKTASIKQKKADKSTPVELDNLPKDTSEKRSDNTDGEMEPSETPQPIDTLTPEETDNTANVTVHPVFSDIIVENLPPKAAAALKEYDEIQLAIPELIEESIPILAARPVDFDAVREMNEKQKDLRERKKDALEILSEYSKEASAELDAIIKREKAAEIVVEEMVEDRDMDAQDAIRRIEELTQ